MYTAVHGARTDAMPPDLLPDEAGPIFEIADATRAGMHLLIQLFGSQCGKFPARPPLVALLLPCLPATGSSQTCWGYQSPKLAADFESDPP
jgi:hypothetical protein